MKALLGDIGRDRQARTERFVFAAQRAVELAHEFRTETGGQRAARQIDDVADVLEADTGERGGNRRCDPQRGQRQRFEQRALLAMGISGRRAVVRGGIGRADGAGDGDAIGKAGAGDALTEIGDQFALAAI